MLPSMMVLMLPLLAINVVSSEPNVTDQESAAFNVTSLTSLETEVTVPSQTLVNNASSVMTTDSSLVTNASSLVTNASSLVTTASSLVSNASSVDTGNATTEFEVVSVTANYSSKTSPGPSVNQTIWSLSNGTTSQRNGTSLSSTSVSLILGLSVFPHGILLALVIVVLIVLFISIVSCCCCSNNSDGSNGPNGAILYEPIAPPSSNRNDPMAPLLSNYRQADFGMMPTGQQQGIRGTTTAYW